MVLSLGSTLAAATCPVTVNTNTDCGYVFTIGPSGAITGAAVAGAHPYDGQDDTLVGIVNNWNKTFTGPISLTGLDIFGFDGDGICTYVTNSGCAGTGYEGPGVKFTVTDANSGIVNVNGLAAGAATFFSLEGDPSIVGAVNIAPTNNTPEPATLSLIGLGLTGLYFIRRRRTV